MKRVLVIGGTGMLGKPVAKSLKAAGFEVRVFTRSEAAARQQLGDGFEFAQGDLANPEKLASAMQGCEGVHINLKGGPKLADYDLIEHRAVARIGSLAKNTGVKRLSTISGYATGAEKADSAETRAKMLGEQALRDTGLPLTIFRCSWIMETLPQFVRGNTLSLIGKQKHPLSWLAADDYARMVAASYQNEAGLNKELYICGPQAYTMEEAFKTYIRISAPGKTIAPVSTGMLRAIGWMSFNPELVALADLMAHYEKWGEVVPGDEANALLGGPTTTLEDWCRQHPLG